MGSSSCAVSASAEEGVGGDSESAVLSSVGCLDGSGDGSEAGVSDEPRSSINRAFWRSSMRAARSEASTF